MYIHIVIKDNDIFGCWSSETDAQKQSRQIIGTKITKMKLNTGKNFIHQINNTRIDPSLFQSWKDKYKQQS